MKLESLKDTTKETDQERLTRLIKAVKAQRHLWQCPHCKRFGHIKRPGDVVKEIEGGSPC